jgi:hypothetical protein
VASWWSLSRAPRLRVREAAHHQVMDTENIDLRAHPQGELEGRPGDTPTNLGSPGPCRPALPRANTRDWPPGAVTPSLGKLTGRTAPSGGEMQPMPGPSRPLSRLRLAYDSRSRHPSHVSPNAIPSLDTTAEIRKSTVVKSLYPVQCLHPNDTARPAIVYTMSNRDIGPVRS